MSLILPLPLELIRSIFELAASTSKPTALSLSLINHTTNTWTQPILYQTVILESSRALKSFLSSISSKHPSFVSRNIRHLGIFTQGPRSAIRDVLDRCVGVSSLACGFPLPSQPERWRTFSEEALKMKVAREQHLLGLSCRDDWDASVLSPSVTHLRIHMTGGSAQWTPDKLASLRDLKHLTHFAIVYRQSFTALAELSPIISDVLENVESLQVLLVQVIGGTRSQRARNGKALPVGKGLVEELNEMAVGELDEPRLVAESAPFSVVRQWEEETENGAVGGVWRDAEVQVASRMKKRNKESRDKEEQLAR